MQEKQVFPTPQEIEAKKSQFNDEINKFINSTKSPSPTQDFLNSIKELISKATKANCPNTQIIRMIKNVYGVNVSSVTFTKFCKKNNIKTKERAKRSES